MTYQTVFIKIIPSNDEKMPQVQPTHNIYFPESIEAAENHILSTIAAGTDGFRLHLPTIEFFSSRFQDFLNLAQDEKRILRYHYYPDESILHIVPWGIIHHVFCGALSSKFLQRLRAGLLPESLWKRLIIRLSQKLMLGPHVDQISQQLAQKKVIPMIKTCDSGFLYKIRYRYRVLTIVVETGFSESYQDLVDDTEQWLFVNRNEVNLVILIDVKEDERVLNTTRNTPEFQMRMKKLVRRFGNDEAKRRYARLLNQSDEDADNDTNVDSANITMTEQSLEDYRSALESEVNVDDWVGPLSVALEFWELKDNKCQRRGPRFPILPRPRKPVHPTIPFIDMIPKAERAKFNKADKSGEMDLDMNEIRADFRSERSNLAHFRALRFLCPDLRGNDSTCLCPNCISN